MTVMMLLGVQSLAWAQYPAPGANMSWQCTNGKVVIGVAGATIADNNRACLSLDTPSQALARTRGSDGCSAGGEPGKTVFKTACLDHDICYSTAGVTKSFCDSTFAMRMDYLCQFFPNQLSNYSVCRAGVSTFYAGVMVGAADAYVNGQNWAEDNCRDPGCNTAVAATRFCQWKSSAGASGDNRGRACYTSVNNRLGTCGQVAGVGACQEVCDQACETRKRVCTTSNRGYACLDNGQAGWCAIDSSNIPRCVQMNSGCDSNCQEAIARRCTQYNAGYACYQGHTKGVCTYSMSIANCKI